METAVTHYVGSRQPPLYGAISTDFAGDVIPVGATVTFYMRAVGSSTLKVNGGAVTVDNAVTGDVHYNWAALDVDTAGFYVGWWRVTLSGGQFEETPEDLIWFQTHAPVTNQYVSVAELKETLSMGGETFADPDIQEAVTAASAVVDQMTGVTFTAVTETRYFTPTSADYIITGPISAITAVTQSGSTLAAADYYIDGGDTLRSKLAYGFTYGPQAVAITATYGYATCPAEVKAAVKIVATQILRRAREAPFGILATSLDGPAIRLGRFDPQVESLLAKYTISPMVE